MTFFRGFGALERIEVCELTELHLLILMNLGDLLSFMEETSVRKEPLAVVSKRLDPRPNQSVIQLETSKMTPIKGEEVQLQGTGKKRHVLQEENVHAKASATWGTALF